MPHKKMHKSTHSKSRSSRPSMSSVGGASSEHVGPLTGVLGRIPNLQPLPTLCLTTRYQGSLSGSSGTQYTLTLLNLFNALNYCNGTNAYIPWNSIKLKSIKTWYAHTSAANFSNIQLVFPAVTSTPGIGALGSETKVYNSDQLGGTGCGMIYATPPRRSLLSSWMSISSVANMTATSLASVTVSQNCVLIIDVEFNVRFYNSYGQPGSSLPGIPSQSSTATGWAGGSFDGGGVLKPQAIQYNGL